MITTSNSNRSRDRPPALKRLVSTKGVGQGPKRVNTPMSRCQDNFRLRYDLCHHPSLTLAELFPQFPHLFPHLFPLRAFHARFACPVPELVLQSLKILLDVVEERTRVRRRRLRVERMPSESGEDTSGMTHPSERNRLREVWMGYRQTRKDVVHRKVGSTADEYALIGAHTLPNDLDEGLRLACGGSPVSRVPVQEFRTLSKHTCAGRTPDKRNLLARKSKVDRFRLRIVQILIDKLKRGGTRALLDCRLPLAEKYR